MIAFLRSILAYLKGAPPLVQVVGVVVLGVLGYFALANGWVGGVGKARSEKAKPASPTVNTGADESTNSGKNANTNNNATTVNVYSSAIGVAKPADYATAGRPDPDKPLNRNADADDQKLAAFWHDQHSEEDNPSWKYITKSPDHIRFVKYRYFSKSDGCLEIQRQEHSGDEITKYVTIALPTTKLHDLGVKSAEANVDKFQGEVFRLSDKSLIKTIKDLVPSTPIVFAAGQGNPTPVQVPSGPQFCLNPHPGGFKWAWGAINGCQQPQYRNFDDGCQHYQIFNVCAKVWEPQVYWTFCRMH